MDRPPETDDEVGSDEILISDKKLNKERKEETEFVRSSPEQITQKIEYSTNKTTEEFERTREPSSQVITFSCRSSSRVIQQFWWFYRRGSCLADSVLLVHLVSALLAQVIPKKKMFLPSTVRNCIVLIEVVGLMERDLEAAQEEAISEEDVAEVSIEKHASATTIVIAMDVMATVMGTDQEVDMEEAAEEIPRDEVDFEEAETRYFRFHCFVVFLICCVTFIWLGCMHT
ncbi:unnamed protein product [Haemonchus placei]|uniref:Transmembrane protein n=1 Tax=Haemonchus placei TaxID=6290 RepID=A0A0N4WAT9_HAEPC|nr:unnamed protein product [Haemonchus placei]